MLSHTFHRGQGLWVGGTLFHIGWGLTKHTKQEKEKRSKRRAHHRPITDPFVCSNDRHGLEFPRFVYKEMAQKKEPPFNGSKKRSPEFPARSLGRFGRRWGLSYRVCQGVQQDQKDTMSIMGYRMFSMESLAAWAVAGSSRIRPSLESRARLRPTRL
jgi:hypothetical protein